MPSLDSRSVFLAMIVIGVVLPSVAVAVIVVALCGQLVILALQILTSAAPPGASGHPLREGPVKPLRFTVHVAAHDEPPALVARTVRALAAQVCAPEFEVIVLDNNTADPRTWRPVQKLCQALGPRFHFHHEDGVRGAKAGALNIALARSDPEASHVVVVDADYEVAPEFLAVAAEEIASRDDDFLQFPQAYRCDHGRAGGISLELADYFHRHARHADGAGAMLLTGTLSVIRRSALETAGGWSGRTITEDAELGLRLRRLGFRGRFVDRVMGRGLLPLDISGLSRQRYRWAAGNVQTILTGFRGLEPTAALHVAAQLTAWVNFALPLAGGLIGGGLALAIGAGSQAHLPLTALAGLGLVLVCFCATAPLILAALLRARPDAATVLGALSARIMLILPSSAGTVDALLGRSCGFRRTAKDAGMASGAAGPALPALAVAGTALLAVPLPPPAVIGALILIAPYPLALATRSRLVEYRSSLLNA